SLFFYASRRRHTRSKRDWSSDVCSSDLTTAVSALSTPRPTTSSQRSTTSSQRSTTEQDIRLCAHPQTRPRAEAPVPSGPASPRPDRKSTRLNSSHVSISYAVFCLKKKKI